MQGKKGLIMGVANDRSIAWGIAQTLANNGASIALTYQGEALKKRVEPLAKSINSDILIPCDVSDSESMGVKILVFSDQSRLSRDIIVQESTFRLLTSRVYSLISS